MTILITGVSKGLGLETTRLLLDRGHTVHGIARSGGGELGELQARHRDRLHVHALDLSDTAHLAEVIMRDIFKPHPIDALVNNAAQAYDDLATNLNLAPLQDMFATNVFGPMVLVKHFIRFCLLRKHPGAMVHLSSISVHTGYKGLAMYAATKGALEAYSKNVAREWGQHGIRSNCVVAGFMETPMTSRLDPSQVERIKNRTAQKELTRPRSVAESIEFLLSPAAHSITGTNVFVDSGTI